MILIKNWTYDEERAFYGENDIKAVGCRFDGPADGESAFKECRDITIDNCFFNLRYPFWHVHGLKICNSEMTSLCRAALWYSDNIEITDTKMHGIKALRECTDIRIVNCDIISPEYGWSSKNINIVDTSAEGEYFLLRAKNLKCDNITLKGKYSFQYTKNAVFFNCRFDTKDAFWHSENVTVRNSIINGEYLAWYSEGLTLENCLIKGTQPLCYCKNLKLINCEMVDCDLSFERSDVEATITSPIDSLKNPLSGVIKAPAAGELIFDIPEAAGKVLIG